MKNIFYIKISSAHLLGNNHSCKYFQRAKASTFLKWKLEKLTIHPENFLSSMSKNYSYKIRQTSLSSGSYLSFHSPCDFAPQEVSSFVHMLSSGGDLLQEIIPDHQHSFVALFPWASTISNARPYNCIYHIPFDIASTVCLSSVLDGKLRKFLSLELNE